MARFRGMYMYAVCDGIADDGHQCQAFVTPELHGDPFGPGHVFAGHLHLTQAGKAANWQMDGDVTRCPKCRTAPRATAPARIEEIDALAERPVGGTDE